MTAHPICSTVSISPRTVQRAQSGVSLIIVLVLLVIVSILGLGASQIATMGERSARNDRDMQVAWQSSEAALMDAQCDIDPANTGANAATPCTGNRGSTFSNLTNTNAFISGCGTGVSAGLCALNPTGKPAWLTADFTVSDSTATTAGFGQFTARSFPSGKTGVRPFQVPRYTIEPIPDPADRDRSGGSSGYIYRVTALGFGPRQDIQAMTQIIYRN